MTNSRSAATVAILMGLSALFGAPTYAQDAAPSAAEIAPGGISYRDDAVTRTFKLLGRNATWTQVSRVATNFTTFHTEGMAKVGDTFFVSAVEVLERTQPNGAKTDSLYDFTIDRSPGAGRGWLFKFDASGQLLGKVELTDGAIYHPGGIDYDGKWLWVPVAEYRPNSKSHIYRIHPETLEKRLVITEDDHLGGVVHDTQRGTLHAVSWGSRRVYTFRVSRDGRVLRADWTPNPSFYIDYQDCHQRGQGMMLCGGLTSYTTPLGSVAFGGLELVDLWRGRPVHQIPVNIFVDEGNGPDAGLALTHNPFWVEPLGNGSLRFYFMPESNSQAQLLTYDVTPWVHLP